MAYIMSRKAKGVLITIFLVSWSAPRALTAQDVVEEPSTGARFPKTVSFLYNGEEYTVTLTGVALRKKFFSKVYGMAHYWNAGDFDAEEQAFDAALSDAYAKQITIVFVRDVEAEDIQKEFRKGIEKNTSDEEMQSISALVEQFLSNFNRDASIGKRYVLRWLPGGVVTVIIHGVETEPIKSVTLAEALWRTWLGKKSIVDRDRLVEAAVNE